MTHGVIAIDPGHAVLDMNESARCLLGLKHVATAGTLISDVLREPVLLSLIDDSEHSEGPVERELTVANGVGGGRRLNMRATALNDADGRRVGTLLVLSDVTLLRHLETVRQDFVANVSHELRTPVTSIKGFAEALLDGALDDPEKAERFVQIIMRQSNHLESIIRDLLELSRLDERAGQSLDQRETPLSEIVEHAVELQQAVEQSLALITHLLAAGLQQEKPLALVPTEGQGTALIEAPRGVLLHSYRLDDQGICTDATIITPTAINQAAIEGSLKALVAALDGADYQQVKTACERLVRCFDPCISCAVH